jgi:hypothetical protein
MTDRPEGSRDPEAIEPEPIDPAAADAPEVTEPEPPEPEVAEAELTGRSEADEDLADAEPLADEELTVAEVEAEEDALAAGATVAQARAETTQRRRAAPVGRRAPTPSEIAVHVNEPWSRIFVLVAIGVFVLILLNGLLLGRGGLITGTPTPRPSASESATPSPSASGSAPASASPSAAESPAASESAAVSPAPSE